MGETFASMRKRYSLIHHRLLLSDGFHSYNLPLLLPKAVVPSPLQMVGGTHTARTNRSPVVRCTQVWDSKCVDTSLCPVAPISGILLELRPSGGLCSDPAWRKPRAANHIDVGKNKQVILLFGPSSAIQGWSTTGPRRPQIWPLYLEQSCGTLHRRLESRESEKWLDRQL